MADDEKEGVQSPVTASLKAEAVGKVSFSREKKITETTPEDVIRARAASWLDIISPVRETALLAADFIHGKREAFRLEREATLGEIAARAAQRRSLAAPVENSVPAKFFVPFVEQASLEDLDSPLVDLWVNLLVSASEHYDPHYIHFVGLLSRMGQRQAETIAGMIRVKTLRKLERACDEIAQSMTEGAIKKTILDQIRNLNVKNTDELAGALTDLFDSPVVSLVHCAFETKGIEDYDDLTYADQYYVDDMEVDFAILQSLGLVAHVSTDLENYGGFNVQVIYFYLTRLGFHFIKGCKILPP